jgi:hypothetical protein
MILQDRSSSMTEMIGGETKWEIASSAVGQMTASFDDVISFGIDFFNENGNCSVSDQAASDTLLANGQNIVDLMIAYGTQQTTPLYLGMQNYLDDTHAPVFFSEGAMRYLIIISDGQDSCGSDGTTAGVGPIGFNITPDDLTTLTTQIVTDFDIGVFVIGFGSGIDPNQLNAIAAAGGTDFTEYLDAQNAAELETTLNAIAESVVGCVYELGEYDPSEVDADMVNFYFDEEPVPHDPGCAQNTGWTWLDEDAKNTVEFCDTACNDLKNGVERISAEMGCPPIEII